ncbi:hypothetical protein B0H12DRAFT_1100163, partial [Mycena haematopus]
LSPIFRDIVSSTSSRSQIEYSLLQSPNLVLIASELPILGLTSLRFQPRSFPVSGTRQTLRMQLTNFHVHTHSLARRPLLNTRLLFSLTTAFAYICSDAQVAKRLLRTS